MEGHRHGEYVHDCLRQRFRASCNRSAGTDVHRRMAREEYCRYPAIRKPNSRPNAALI